MKRIATMLIGWGLLAGLLTGFAPAQLPPNAMTEIRIAQLSQQSAELCRSGQYDQAIGLAELALAMREKLVGSPSTYPAYIWGSSPLVTLIKAYHAKGDDARLELLCQRILKLSELVLAEKAPDWEKEIAASLNDMATLYEAKDNYSRSLQLRLLGNEIRERDLVKALTPTVKDVKDSPDQFRIVGSERYKLGYLDSVAEETRAIISLNVRYLPEDKQATKLALTAILQRKGRALDATAEDISILRRSGTPKDQELINQLTRANSQMANLSNSNQSTTAPQDPNVAQVTSNEAQVIEIAMSMRSAELRKPAVPVTLTAVRQAIPADAALVEFYSYLPFNAKATGETPSETTLRYVAYVLLHDDDAPQLLELNDAPGIDRALIRLRAALRDPKRNDIKELARDLDERVMRPVRKLLGETRRVFLSPDGALNLLPFAALVDENGKYLVENYSINYLTSGRDLLRLRVTGGTLDVPMVIANPLFDLSARGQQQPTGQSSDRLAGESAMNQYWKDLSAVNYQPLSGTAAEAAALSQLLRNARVVTGAGATEAVLKRIHRPRLLHIATHGFFFPDPLWDAAAGKRNESEFNSGAALRMSLRLSSPLLRSGLILAGVRQQASGADEDGVLTGLEVVGLDLLGTRLVVLSACETGLGDVKNGAGVFGLRRALLLAGSETQVTSLWKVSDSGTRDLMVAYYTRLQQGESRTEALRQVQLAMLRGQALPTSTSGVNRQTGDTDETAATKDYRHPYYWAAFIPSGDWRNMDGK